MRMKALVLAAVVAAAVSTMKVQVAAGGQKTPAALELKTILYTWPNSLGMLRGLDEAESIASLDYWARGTMNLNGQPCTLTDYWAGLNYHIPGMRVAFTCTTADGTTHRQIQVVADKYAWNEAKPGVDATPMMGAVTERLLQLWSGPQAVVKAARLPGANPKAMLESGKIVLTFPVPGVAAATIKATLSPKNQTERVETRLGNTVIETTYSDYGELNDSDYKADVLLPRRILQKRGAVTLLDLTVTRTNTVNPYVIMPVPDNVKKAVTQQ